MKKQQLAVVVILFTLFSIYPFYATAQDTSPTPTTPPLADYMVTATAGPGGSIDPSGDMFTTPGESHSFKITPDNGYRILDVSDNGVSQGAISSYILSNIHENHQVVATFTQAATDNTIIYLLIVVIVAVVVIALGAIALQKSRRK